MGGRNESTWTFLTNHGHVFVFVARNPDARIRDISEAVGITERATQAILRDLIDAGYVSSQRVGRRNTYSVDRGRAMRHPAESERLVGEFLEVFTVDHRQDPGAGAGGGG